MHCRPAVSRAVEKGEDGEAREGTGGGGFSLLG
jgi:hypothetical protein